MASIGYLALSCREELAFHGYPLRRPAPSFGVWGAQLMVAFLFAAEHVAGGSRWVDAIFGAGVGSLLFGMASLTTRGLAVPIGLHAAWNFGDWLRGGKGTIGPWRQVIDDGLQGRAQLVAMVSYVMLMCLLTLASWRWGRMRDSDETRPPFR